MKASTRILTGFLCIVTLWSCYKSDAPDPLIVGEWVWNGSSGGIGGARYTPAPTERTILRFDANQQFSLYRNDTLLSTGTYSMGTVRSIYSGKDEPEIRVQSRKVNQQVRYGAPIVIGGVVSTLTTDQLSIGDNAYDGYGSGFTRRK